MPPAKASPQSSDCAIIIPHYNDTDRLRTCLEALTAGTQDKALLARAEILVVDNGTPGGLAPLEAAFPIVRFLTEAERGAGAARNQGVAQSTAPRIFFIDADCVPAPDWLATALQVIEGKDLVGGRVKTFDETPPPRSGAQGFETVFAFNQDAYINSKGFSVTANLLTWRRIFDDTGPFNNAVSEDVDWCWRARAKGYQIIYAPDLQVGHPTRSDWPALRHKWQRLTREMFLLNGTSFTKRLKWLFRSTLVAAAPFAFVFRVLRHPRLNGAGERWRATTTLFRLYFQRALWMIGQALSPKASK